MSYGIILWGISTGHNKVFLLQKKIVRIIANDQRSELCRNSFKGFCILTFASEYIFALMTFVVNDIFQPNSELHKVSTGNRQCQNKLPILQCTRKMYIMQEVNCISSH
jgi:hypothetical protein